jgi:indole-3-glycerol phosphate synthase
MSDILNKINATKQIEVEEARAILPFDDLHTLALATLKSAPPRDFTAAIRSRIEQRQPAVIAEIKKASPSKGVLRDNFAPAEIAREYEQAGAACLSVLTDELYFQGHPDFLKAARAACSLPVLRKDFIVDKYQIAQARVWGADAILLIAASLTVAQMQAFEAYSHLLGMSVLVEVHNDVELYQALQLQTPLLGINNRNLRTFEVDINTTLEMLEQIPSHKMVITESGISSQMEVNFVLQHGVYGFLVGEAFMRAPHAGQALSELFFA